MVQPALEDYWCTGGAWGGIGGASIFGSLLLIDRTLVRNWRSTWRNVNKRWRHLRHPVYATATNNDTDTKERIA